MHDLKLWQLLKQPDCDAGDLATQLLELADTEEAFRCVYFARVAPLVEHENPGVRAAALKVLSDSGGWKAFEKIVGLLCDTEAEVRAAAVDAMVASAGDDPARWAQGLFHPSSEIRSSVLEAAVDDAIPLVGSAAMYLLASSEHHALIEELIQRVMLSTPPLALLIELLQAGQISERQARLVLSRSRLGENSTTDAAPGLLGRRRRGGYRRSANFRR